MPNSEYIIHGTSDVNLIKILKAGYIDNNPSKKDLLMLREWDVKTKQIFTQLIYKDIPNEKYQNPHWYSAAIVLDKKILKDYPFYATHIGGFKDKFENGKTNEKTIIYGDGNLSRMPNLTKLKNAISKRLNNFKNLGILNFMHSHEILFNQKIPLDKYCKCIVIMGTYLKPKEKQKLVEQIEKINTFHIPIKFYTTDRTTLAGLGINKFIDVIEKD
jgi:hypothetical protein